MDEPQLSLAEQLEVLADEILEFAAHPFDVYATERREEIQQLLWRIELANGSRDLTFDWQPTEAFLDLLYARAVREHVEPPSFSDDGDDPAPAYLDSPPSFTSDPHEAADDERQ
eukprot:GHVU01013398.1.p2 GENE.GHVU01013398.1~~GHVU01013398.1.p2  ORF type:complete len:114 (+),score=24.51 GHVU01013398.1:524-865(+)